MRLTSGTMGASMQYYLPRLAPIYARISDLAYPMTRWVGGFVFAVHGAARFRIIDIGGNERAGSGRRAGGGYTRFDDCSFDGEVRRDDHRTVVAASQANGDELRCGRALIIGDRGEEGFDSLDLK